MADPRSKSAAAIPALFEFQNTEEAGYSHKNEILRQHKASSLK
jgi:hypothetical protein